MRRLLALAAALALVVAAPAGAATTKGHHATHTARKAKTTKKVCHWVKATKKRKRHKVCFFRKKATRPATGQKPAATPAKPLTPPAAPGTAPAPAPILQAGSPTDTAATATPAPAPAPVATTAPARLQVTTREWSLALSRATVPAGSVITELVNRGEDGHDLHVRPAAGGPDVLAIPETASGAVFDSDPTTLAAGTYTLYCSLPGHEAAGMHATLTVR